MILGILVLPAMLSWKKPALWEIYGDLLVTSSCKLLITSYITIYKAQTNYSENPTFFFHVMLCGATVMQSPWPWPGVTNGFLAQSAHEFALGYNDLSCLQNMSCAKLGCSGEDNDAGMWAWGVNNGD
jgi:hypothetical protein